MAETATSYMASHRYARITPRKARYVMDLVRRQPVEKSLQILRFCPRRGAPMIAKVIQSALANAIQEGAAHTENMVICDARVDEGPTGKRWRPRARGMAFPILKRTSHLTIVISEEANSGKKDSKKKKKKTRASSESK